MLCKDLIKILEGLIESNKPYVDTVGEAEVFMDVFTLDPEHKHLFRYQGISPHFNIRPSEDGVFDILTTDVRSLQHKVHKLL